MCYRLVVWTVLFIDEAATERLSLPATERNALLHAVEKLEAFGPSPGFPHSSSVQGFPGLRELRPRATIAGSRRQHDWPWRGLRN